MQIDAAPTTHDAASAARTATMHVEGVGALAAGIAHELNTPMQFVSDNMHFLRDAFAELLRALDGGEADTEFLVEEIPVAIEQTLEGVARASRIVQALRAFSHPGGEELRPTDLRQVVENALEVSRNTWKYSAEVAVEVEPGMPLVPADAGPLTQAVTNLLVNAAHAVQTGDAGDRGSIVVSISAAPPWAEISVSDDGCGIPETDRARIFEPFYTTKPVGQGTGQGLPQVQAVARSHQGEVVVDSQVGGGSTIALRIPLGAAG